MKLTLLQFVSYNEIDLIFCLYLKHLYFFFQKIKRVLIKVIFLVAVQLKNHVLK